MATKQPPEGIHSSYQRLVSAAASLNKASDTLGASIAEIDAALKKLNIGIECWSTFYEFNHEDGITSYERQIGYAKIEKKWGIALREGEYFAPAGEYSFSGQWLFNDAPRDLRVSGIEALPNLLDALAEKAIKTAANISGKIDIARAFAEALQPPASDKGSK